MTRVAFLSNYPVPHQAELLRALDRQPTLTMLPIFLRDRDPGREWPGEILEGKARFATLLGPRKLRDELKPAIDLKGAVSADLLLLGGYSFLAFQQAMVARALARRPTLLWAETPRIGRGSLLARTIRNGLLAAVRRSAGILAIGPRAVAMWREVVRGACPVIDFPYLCDIDRFLAIERPARLAPAPFRILFSGQLIERKGVDVLAQAFLVAQRAEPRLRLILAGTGPLRASLESTLAEAAPGSVEFRGHLPWSELRQLYAEADAFCLPSLHDGWGMVINEAMASGLPIISSTAVGAADALVDASCGILVPPGELQPLANALLAVVPGAAVRGSAARAIAQARLEPDAGAARFAKIAQAAAAGQSIGGL